MFALAPLFLGERNMRIGKKILIYLFCGFLTFSVVSSSYYKTAHAFEYVGGALAFEEALKWLLAAIGITATAGMTDAYWDAYGDEFVDYAVQNGATQQEVAEWQLKACEGILDKASNVWTQFKSWASSLVSGSSDVVVPSVGANTDEVVNYLNSLYNLNIPTNGLTVLPCYAICLQLNSTGGFSWLRLFTDNTTYSLTKTGSIYYINASSIEFQYKYGSQAWRRDTASGRINANLDSIFSSNIINNTGDNINIVDYGDTPIIGDSNFEGVTNNVNDLDVISSSGVNEEDDEVAVPYPGVSDSDNTLANDTYQDIVDKINDGTITQEQGIEQIQELLRVITYDTVTDEVVPPQKNDDGTNKTKEDALKENKENAGFTLAGLENVFPFCIPFDIYAFMTLLVADPECPEFDFPIKTVNGQEETIHVDLQPFEPVAVVVRYVFDFLFIVGLAMLTRSLIGGGSSD